MAKAEKAPKTGDKVIANVYRQMKVQESTENFVTEVATGMVTQAEISTRLGSARRAGHRAGLLQGRRESAATLAAKDAEIVRMKAEIAALKASAKLRGQVQI